MSLPEIEAMPAAPAKTSGSLLNMNLKTETEGIGEIEFGSSMSSAIFSQNPLNDLGFIGDVVSKKLGVDLNFSNAQSVTMPKFGSGVTTNHNVGLRNGPSLF